MATYGMIQAIDQVLVAAVDWVAAIHLFVIGHFPRSPQEKA
jgi:hypothetical protein